MKWISEELITDSDELAKSGLGSSSTIRGLLTISESNLDGLISNKVQNESLVADVGILTYPSVGNENFRLSNVKLHVYIKEVSIAVDAIRRYEIGLRGCYYAQRYEPRPEGIRALKQNIVDNAMEEYKTFQSELHELVENTRVMTETAFEECQQHMDEVCVTPECTSTTIENALEETPASPVEPPASLDYQSQAPLNGASSSSFLESHHEGTGGPPESSSVMVDPVTSICSSEAASKSILSRPLLIGVMGLTGSGKSQFINTAISTENRSTGHESDMNPAKVEVSPSFVIGGQEVILIDTPGFDDPVRSDTEVFEEIAVCLAESYRDDHRLSGIIYLHRISDNRVGGTAVKDFDMFRKLCGDDALKNAVIATTRWDEVPGTVAEERERELRTNEAFFKPALDRGARLLRYYNSHESACEILKTVLANTPLPLLVQTEVVDQTRELMNTTAGELVSKHQSDMEEKRDIEEFDCIEDVASYQADTGDLAGSDTKKLPESYRRVSGGRKGCTIM
ncbi:hypothetical protein V5O48_015789 [Marasmius crinis-equi]|uniref:AIG1-type G domain-containing protein n=1 Tax=Marasmius crinis-equi TaxID=585013 RepID=A0ABR3ETK2_9AGAR